MNDKTASQRCADVIDQEVRSIISFVEATSSAFDKAEQVAGSGMERLSSWVAALPASNQADVNLIEAYRAIVDESANLLLRLLGNAFDHAQSLTTVLRSDFPPMGSALTLSRGVLEAVLQVATILDRHIHPQQALLRVLAYEVATVEGNENMAQAFGKIATEAQRTRSSEGVDGLYQWLDELGIERVPRRGASGRRTASLRLGDEKTSIDFDATAAMKRYLHGNTYSYALLSGAAHSRGWMLATTYLPNEEGNRTTPDQMHLVATLPLLDGAEALVQALGWFAGVDSAPLVNKTHFRRRSLLLAAGSPFSPMSWEDYRARPKKTAIGRSFARNPGRWDS